MASFEDELNGILHDTDFAGLDLTKFLGSQDSSDEENDLDETMEDVDEGDQDGDGEGEGDADEDDNEGDNEDEEGENEDEEDQDEAESPSNARMRARVSSRPLGSPRPLPNGVPSEQSDSTLPAASFTSPSPHPSIVLPYRPSVRPEAITASTYDIIPTIAAPQSTSINAVTATPDMRWVFSGGTDGYVRKFHWPDSANGKVPLTVAQKHPFVDSVVKAGVLLSYWENEDFSDRTRANTRNFDDSVPVSPVYSLAVHNQALWLLAGAETGSINLYSVRHGEGTRITSLTEHKSAVSVLQLSRDERSVLSGSWDKNIFDWDLDTGKVKRTFAGSGGQISALEPRPTSSLPVPEESGSPITFNETFSSNNAAPPRVNGIMGNGIGDDGAANGTEDAPAEQDDDMNSLFGDDDDTGTAGGEAGMADFAVTAPDTTNGIPDASNEAPSMPGLDEEDDEFSRAIQNGLQDAEPLDADVSGDVTMADTEAGTGGAVQPPEPNEAATQDTTTQQTDTIPNGVSSNGPSTSETLQPNGATDSLPHSDEPKVNGIHTVFDSTTSRDQASETTFLSSSFDGVIRIWDRRQPNPIARILPPRGTPVWCMSACWSSDGNFIYAGRRNNSVEEYSLHNTNSSLGMGWAPSRTFRFPNGSGAVSALRCMPNGRHLIWYVPLPAPPNRFEREKANLSSASYDIVRLYDLHAHTESTGRHSIVPFLIVPGHRTGIISQLFIDPTCRFLISTAGNRGWEGASTEVLLGYEIGIPQIGAAAAAAAR